jgi:poly(A) polymerase
LASILLFYFSLYVTRPVVLIYLPVSPILPTIISRSEHSISRKWISHNAVRVLYRLREQGYHAYLVGGGVRDLLLGREPKDFDVATDARPNEVKKVFRNCRLIGRRFRLAHVHFPNEIIEVATFRSSVADEPEPVPPEPSLDHVSLPGIESNSTREVPVAAGSVTQEGEVPVIAVIPSATDVAAKPKPPRMLKTEDGMILRDNVFGTPEEDALRRDFTVNALFYSIADFSVIDYVGGMEDLRKGLIRIIGDPVIRFTEDPVRMVRAVRFAAMLGFEIEKNTYRALLELKDKVALASPARMYEEVLKLFLLGEGEKTYQLLRKTGLFSVIFPRLNEWVDSETDGFPHTTLGKALEWIDTCVQSGRQVQPYMLFALLFGQYIEEKVGLLMTGGANPLDAATKAVAETLMEEAHRVMIPKKVGLVMRDIYWNQHRFDRREGKYPRYFLRRPGFSDAFEYLRFTTEVTGLRRELRAWWKEFIKANPLGPAEQKEIQKNYEKRARPHRGRRRRNGGGKRPLATDPKA